MDDRLKLLTATYKEHFIVATENNGYITFAITKENKSSPVNENKVQYYCHYDYLKHNGTIKENLDKAIHNAKIFIDIWINLKM